MPKGLRILIIVKQYLLQCIVRTCLRSAFLKTINYCQSHHLAGFGPAKGNIDQRLAAVANRAYAYYQESTACRTHPEGLVWEWCHVRRLIQHCEVACRKQ